MDIEKMTAETYKKYIFKFNAREIGKISSNQITYMQLVDFCKEIIWEHAILGHFNCSIGNYEFKIERDFDSYKQELVKELISLGFEVKLTKLTCNYDSCSKLEYLEIDWSKFKNYREELP